ncbi:glycosyltransferase family 2 protein [Capnocytophaga leadbetteri]|jgi:glycosyltransferase|uniref:glycosyltransferase family 2 protein n=1 Tax=Capnocytophaga leadbetteri TaxID=327575 RepID=UPI0028E41604|nr:glycosyltransferase family 2 protein [Capnocytophaga leadbetteri]
MKISVVIPVYKVEPYIEKCLNSVKNQTFTEFECLIIDDGSPDNSIQIAQQCIEKDSRFRIITQKNKGLGGARNTGIDNAKGEWIIFLDSDDWWEPNLLEKMYTEAIKNEVDFIVCRYKKISSKGDFIGYSDSLPEGIYTSKDTLIRFFLELPTAWNKLYKRSIWEGVRYPEQLYYEDLPTTYQLIFKCNKVQFIDEGLYCYNLREGSMLRHFSQKQVDDRFELLKLIEQTFAKHPEYNAQKWITYAYLVHIPYTLHIGIMAYADKHQARTVLKELKKRLNPAYFNPKSIWGLRKDLGIGRTVLLLSYYYSLGLSCALFSLRDKLAKLLKR